MPDLIEPDPAPFDFPLPLFLLLAAAGFFEELPGFDASTPDDEPECSVLIFFFFGFLDLAARVKHEHSARGDIGEVAQHQGISELTRLSSADIVMVVVEMSRDMRAQSQFRSDERLGAHWARQQPRSAS